MDEKQLQALANELAKNLKTPEDLSQFDRLLKKLSVEAAHAPGITHVRAPVSAVRPLSPVLAV